MFIPASGFVTVGGDYSLTVGEGDRFDMSQFLNNPNYKVFYIDTDGIFINKALDDNLVSSTILGKMKLEKRGLLIN